MIVGLIFAVSVAVVLLTLLGYVPVLWALPAIGVVVAILIGYLMRRTSGPGGP